MRFDFLSPTLPFVLCIRCYWLPFLSWGVYACCGGWRATARVPHPLRVVRDGRVPTWRLLPNDTIFAYTHAFAMRLRRPALRLRFYGSSVCWPSSWPHCNFFSKP